MRVLHDPARWATVGDRIVDVGVCVGQLGAAVGALDGLDAGDLDDRFGEFLAGARGVADVAARDVEACHAAVHATSASLVTVDGGVAGPASAAREAAPPTFARGVEVPMPDAVSELGASHWPRADVDGLRHAAAALARHRGELTSLCRQVGSSMPDDTGYAFDAMNARLTDLLTSDRSSIARLITSVQSTSTMLSGVADAADETRERMRVIVARVERDRVTARVLELIGEPPLVRPAFAGATALASAGDEYRGRVRELVGRHHDSPTTALAAPLGLGVLGGVGAAGSLRIRRRPAPAPPDRRDDAVHVRRRVAALNAAIADHPTTRMAVARVRAPNGEVMTLLATSERRGYLRPGVGPEPGELLVGGRGEPRSALVRAAKQRSMTVLSIGTTDAASPISLTGGTSGTIDGLPEPVALRAGARM